MLRKQELEQQISRQIIMVAGMHCMSVSGQNYCSYNEPVAAEVS